MFDFTELIQNIEVLISDVSKELHLPDGFLKMVENQNSHSLWIFEPVTKAKSQMILTVTQRGKKDSRYARIEIKKSIVDRSRIPNFICYEKDMSMCYCDVTYNNVYSLLYAIVHDSAKSFVPSEKFGCCGKFKECSRVGKCLHDNQFYAKACWYRKNLESGRVFY